jgi:ribosomal protein S3
MNKYWKSKYFEKNINESHAYIFKSLEIKQYLQKILKNQGFTLHEYRLNFSNDVLNIFISMFRTEQALFIVKQKKSTTEKSRIFIEKKLTKLKKELKKYYKRKHLLNNLSTRTKYIRILKLYRTCLLKLDPFDENTLKTLKLRSFSKKLLESLNLFTNNKININLIVQEINSINASSQAKQILLKLRKFERSPFFAEGKRFLIPFITQNNSAKLLSSFMSAQLKTIKRHNFFFNFLKESLHLIINQKISNIQGVKLIIKGRLNNAARAKHRIITIGKIPLTTINSKIDYSESTAFTSNGTLGVKVWVAEKTRKIL